MLQQYFNSHWITLFYLLFGVCVYSLIKCYGRIKLLAYSGKIVKMIRIENWKCFWWSLLFIDFMVVVMYWIG